MGGVCTIPARHSAHALLVAVEHDMGWSAGQRPPRLHRLLRPSCSDRLLSRALLELEIPVACAYHAAARRPRCRLFWAFAFTAILGAQLGVFYYGRVIEGLALCPGTKHQYPLYDSLAMGVQMMLFTYILGRTHSQERTLIEAWADSKSTSRLRASFLSIARPRAAAVSGRPLDGGTNH